MASVNTSTIVSIFLGVLVIILSGIIIYMSVSRHNNARKGLPGPDDE